MAEPSVNVHDINARGPYRFTREGRSVFHLPLVRPWSWALTHHGMWSVFVTDEEPARTGVPARRMPLHPPQGLLGHWLAIYATREYDADAVRWLRAAHGLEAPAGDVLPAGAYVAMARLAEVSTIGNDSRSFGSDPWWAPRGAPYCRGTIAWWLEEIVVFEPLPAPSAGRLTHVDAELLPELRERVRMARDGIWRPEVFAVPVALPLLTPEPEEPPAPSPLPAAPAPARHELPADDSPVAPMGAVEQLGLFGEVLPRPAPAVARETPVPPMAPEEKLTQGVGTQPSSAPKPTTSDSRPSFQEPAQDLHAAASRVRELLARGEASMAEVMGAAGQDGAGRTLLYRVTCLPGTTPRAHQVPVVLRGDGQGGCWYVAAGTPALACPELAS